MPSFSALFAISSLIAVVLAMPQDLQGGPYEFPAGVDEILSNPPVIEAFSCEGRDNGYYADINNNCEIFHVCHQILDNDEVVVEVLQYSFACGNQTQFDQQTLTCNHKEDAFPCEESESLYNAIEIGYVERK